MLQTTAAAAAGLSPVGYAAEGMLQLPKYCSYSVGRHLVGLLPYAGLKCLPGCLPPAAAKNWCCVARARVTLANADTSCVIVSNIICSAEARTPDSCPLQCNWQVGSSDDCPTPQQLIVIGEQKAGARCTLPSILSVSACAPASHLVAMSLPSRRMTKFDSASGSPPLWHMCVISASRLRIGCLSQALVMSRPTT